MKKILIILLLTLATILPTFATNWVQFYEKGYIDIDTIEPYVNDSGRVVPNQYSFWTKFLNDGSEFWRKYEKIYNKKFWYIYRRCIIDVNRKASAIKMIIIYDLKGNVVDRHEYSYLEWESIVPNTIGDFELFIIKQVINGVPVEE